MSYEIYLDEFLKSNFIRYSSRVGYALLNEEGVLILIIATSLNGRK